MGKILHISRSPCAGAIEAMSSAINDHTEHTSLWVGTGDVGSLSFTGPDLKWTDTEVYAALYDADVLILHNYVGVQEQPIKDFLEAQGDKIVCGFFHSHPKHCNVGLQKLGFPIAVPAQFQALLHEGSKAVRQVIRYDRGDWPKWQPNERGTVRIGYAPTSHIPQTGEPGDASWYDSKGYPQTIKLLEEVEDADDRVELVIIDGVRHDMALRLKATCDIFIDEVVTGSYHRNSLEALAMGIPTICAVAPEVLGIVAGVTGCTDWFPFLHSSLETLKADLLAFVDRPFEERLKMGEDAREWMVRYWQPRDIVRDFCDDLFQLPRVSEVMA